MEIGLNALAYKQKTSEANLVKQEGKLAAEMEGVAALQRETDRKIELVKSISAQRARAGASGIDTNTGSPLALINQTIKDSQRDTERDAFNTKIAKQSALYRANARAGQIKGEAKLSLLRSVYDSASSAATGAAKGGK